MERHIRHGLRAILIGTVIFLPGAPALRGQTAQGAAPAPGSRQQPAQRPTNQTRPASPARPASAARFDVEEATIADVHRAIQSGRTTCTAIVQTYIDRARAYNGVCTQLVTRDGAPVAAETGPTRAGRPVAFPTSTVPVSTVLPDADQYAGVPLDLGHMATTASDADARQQYGMVVGIPRAGQINALATLNIRGERSVSCRATCDAAPASGPLPASCPAACDAFRRQPDALERAAELDAKYGRHPDLTAMPMYCVAMSFKDVFDTTEMRSTGGADVNYAMDAPSTDATIVARLRAKGAIIYAKANLDEYNAGSGDPGGDAKAAARSYGAGARSTWGGMACNPYDTTRETGGSSSGSASSVSANLSACSICEETGGSCRQPAWRNGIVSLVTTKGLLPYGGAIGADPYLDRAGIDCRTVADTARVFDAIADSKDRYFDARDIYSALPPALAPPRPYASFTTGVSSGSKAGAKADPKAGAKAGSKGGTKPLAGLRVGIVREYMVKHSANDAAMSDLVDAEIKKVLRDQLGAEIVESVDPLYPDDPAVANMTYTFQQALAEILPMHMPAYLQRKGPDGAPLFAVPGFDVTSRDYMVKAAEGLAPFPAGINLRSVNNTPSTASFAFDLARYLLRRGDARVSDWASLNANATYHSATRVAAMKNWEHKTDLVSDGMTFNIQMREVMRLVVEKVMRQNHLDVLVNPTTTIPPAKIGYANQPAVNNRPVGRFPTSANMGVPEITVPAGFNRVIYEPRYKLNAAKSAYETVANEEQRTMLDDALPVGISFWGGPGDEPVLLEVAAAYEAATHHRTPPPAFGPTPQEPRVSQVPNAQRRSARAPR